VTLVAVDSDALVPAADIEAFASAIPDAAYRCISSRFGHDAFLKEDAAIAAILSSFLSSLELAE
jgi:homoserine O-acetyltransferase